jgi:hypothetical protein
MSWIDVKDKLPNEGELVLVYAPECFINNETENGYTFGMMDKNGLMAYAIGGYDCGYTSAMIITHWMPLPEPPKIER